MPAAVIFRTGREFWKTFFAGGLANYSPVEFLSVGIKFQNLRRQSGKYWHNVLTPWVFDSTPISKLGEIPGGRVLWWYPSKLPCSTSCCNLKIATNHSVTSLLSVKCLNHFTVANFSSEIYVKSCRLGNTNMPGTKRSTCSRCDRFSDKRFELLRRNQIIQDQRVSVKVTSQLLQGFLFYVVSFTRCCLKCKKPPFSIFVDKVDQWFSWIRRMKKDHGVVLLCGTDNIRHHASFCATS